MDSFSDEDIEYFLKSYKNNLLEGVAPNPKIPVWIEYLKTKKHYRQNGMQEDFFFNKRFNMTNEDLINLQKIMNRVLRGKKINKMNRSTVQANILSNPVLDNSNPNMYSPFDKLGTNIYSGFDENMEITEKDASKFELLSQVTGAMDDYYSKMKKAKEKKLSWKNGNKDYRYQRELDMSSGSTLNSNSNSNSYSNSDSNSYDNEINNEINYRRNLAMSGSIQDVNNPYYIEQEYSARPQVEYDVQSFAKSPLYNMSKTNIINRIDEISNILNNNNLITTDFDNGRAVPVVMTNKPIYSIRWDTDLINKQLQDENYMGLKNKDPSATRFWQDQDILNPGSQTRKPSIKNKQPFENHFQYLDCNYNRVMDPRLIGQGSRMDNRAKMER
jgi:hypothetical protein